MIPSRLLSGAKTRVGERERSRDRFQFTGASSRISVIPTREMRKGALMAKPVGVEVQAQVYPANVEIWHQGKCVGRQERSFGRFQNVLDLEHYLEALLKNPDVVVPCRTASREPALIMPHARVLRTLKMRRRHI